MVTPSIARRLSWLLSLVLVSGAGAQRMASTPSAVSPPVPRPVRSPVESRPIATPIDVRVRLPFTAARDSDPSWTSGLDTNPTSEYDWGTAVLDAHRSTTLGVKLAEHVENWRSRSRPRNQHQASQLRNDVRTSRVPNGMQIPRADRLAPASPALRRLGQVAVRSPRLAPTAVKMVFVASDIWDWHRGRIDARTLASSLAVPVGGIAGAASGAFASKAVLFALSRAYPPAAAVLTGVEVVRYLGAALGWWSGASATKAALRGLYPPTEVREPVTGWLLSTPPASW